MSTFDEHVYKYDIDSLIASCKRDEIGISFKSSDDLYDIIQDIYEYEEDLGRNGLDKTLWLIASAEEYVSKYEHYMYTSGLNNFCIDIGCGYVILGATPETSRYHTVDSELFRIDDRGLEEMSGSNIEDLI